MKLLHDNTHPGSIESKILSFSAVKLFLKYVIAVPEYYRLAVRQTNGQLQHGITALSVAP